MADATIKAWRCDLCGEVFKESSAGYNCYYDLSMTCVSGADIHGLEIHEPQICLKCVQRITDAVVEIENERQ